MIQYGELGISNFFGFVFPVMIHYTILYHMPNHRVEYFLISALSEASLFSFFASVLRSSYIKTDERAISLSRRPSKKIWVL